MEINESDIIKKREGLEILAKYEEEDERNSTREIIITKLAKGDLNGVLRLAVGYHIEIPPDILLKATKHIVELEPNGNVSSYGADYDELLYAIIAYKKLGLHKEADAVEKYYERKKWVSEADARFDAMIR